MTPSATPQPTRGWWPRSLLGRNLLLMAVLIVLGQLVAAIAAGSLLAIWDGRRQLGGLRQRLGGSRNACLPRFRRFSGAPHAGKAQEIPPGTPARGRGRCHLSLGTGG